MLRFQCYFKICQFETCLWNWIDMWNIMRKSESLVSEMLFSKDEKRQIFKNWCSEQFN